MARETYGDGTADKRKREEARRLVLVRALKIASLVTSAPYQYTRPRLATDFEVSERTIDRDLAFLRGLGWEIERDRERGYAFARAPRLPPVPLTLPDVLALTLAAELACDSGDIDTASLGAALARLLDAVPTPARPLLQREVLRRAEGQRAGAGRRAALGAVQQALLEGRRARIVYATGEQGRRDKRARDRALRRVLVRGVVDDHRLRPPARGGQGLQGRPHRIGSPAGRELRDPGHVQHGRVPARDVGRLAG